LNPQERAESLFHDFLASGGSVEDFLRPLHGTEDAQVVDELEQILEDYQALREGRITSSGSRHLAGPQAGTVLHDYRLLTPIGRGGMGVVWEAQQLSLDRRVAVKVLHAHLGISGRVLERFQREAQAGGRLDHGGIVTVIGAGEQDGIHFIVQELVHGGVSMETWLREQAHQSELPSGDYRRIAAWLLEIAEALAVAHEAGVVHRDLKPGNILLQAGHPKLADFGLARLAEEASISLSGEVLGTPYYMSPEQARAHAIVDARSDLFALGVTFYEMLTLRRPFAGDTREQVLEAIRNEDPDDPRRLRSRLPRDLAVICLKLLEKNPAQRYPSAHSLADDLRRFLDGRPIRARPPGVLVRAWKWMRRHPAHSTAMVVSALAIVVILGFYLEARRARTDAEDAATLAQQRQHTAEAIEGFLIDLFADAGPGGEADARTPAGELLTRGAERLEQDEEQDPVVRAGLLMALGQVNKLLGDFPQAEQQLREALRLHERHLLTLDQRTLKAQNQLGLLLLARVQYAEAEQLLLAAQQGHETLYGKDSIEALENQGNLAYVYYAQGDYDRAAPLLEASLRGTTARWGEDHFHAWSARNNLAALQMRRGDFAAAEGLFERILAHRVVAEGPTAPSTIAVLGNLAQAEKDQGKFDEAEEHMRQLLAACLETFGDDHPTTASAYRDLAGLRFRQHRYDDALSSFRQADRIGRAKLRVSHPSALSAREGVVRCLLALDRADEALPLAEALARDATTADVRAESRQGLLEEVRIAADSP
jgi:tetratricopeptide (TPR) repeat protein